MRKAKESCHSLIKQKTSDFGENSSLINHIYSEKTLMEFTSRYKINLILIFNEKLYYFKF